MSHDDLLQLAPTSNSGTEASVYQRYAAAAQQREEALCCPVNYVSDYLKVIPQEIIERDYGCGDPTSFAREGETVLDLGAGGGKLCYILAQVVGAAGRVIGVDCNLEMLSLARKYQEEVAGQLGFANVDFRYGMIQDLKLNLDLLGEELARHPVADANDWLALRNLEEKLSNERPLVEPDSIDCVVSNCVLNLVRQQDRRQLFAEIYRVLRDGGRAAISDIVSDEDVPDRMQQDPQLWSGCISGAFREDQFLTAFEEAGFHGIEIVKRQSEPWRTVEGIEFRSVTVVAHKGKSGPRLDRNQAVIYRGPFKEVLDDDGHFYARGARMAVCDKTYQLLQRAPYAGMFEPIDPQEETPLNAAQPFPANSNRVRLPTESKGINYSETSEAAADCCGEGSDCC